MPATSELMASGMPSQQARLLGLDPITTFSAAGTTSATATVLTADFANVNVVGANSGVRLPSPSTLPGLGVVVNTGSNVLTIYPHTGGQINGLAANTGVTLAPNKAAHFINAGTQWAAIIGA